jgi:hypothetical protein
MTLNVAPAAPIIATMSLEGNQIGLDWSGGIPPYQVQTGTNLSSPAWQPLGAPMSGTHLDILPTNDASFYRIVGQ